MANLEVRRGMILDSIHEKGHTQIEDTVIAGVPQKATELTEGLSSFLLDGEAEFDPKSATWTTKGLHLFYNSEFYRVLNREEYYKREVDDSKGNFAVWVQKTIKGNGQVQEERTKAFLVRTDKPKYTKEDFERMTAK